VSLLVSPLPVPPHCVGSLWSVHDQDVLASLCAEVLIGRALHASMILDGAPLPGVPTVITVALKERLQRELHPTSQPKVYHRDGLLFEIISWIAARSDAEPDSAISDPHLKATTQGTDCVKVSVDPVARTITEATVYEYKCTTNWRQKFGGEVLAAFREYVSGARDNQLSQAAIPLLTELGFSREERGHAYDVLVQQRPLAFQASLTVAPSGFGADERLALFAGYDTITAEVARRAGNTFPLDDIRAWFADFSTEVWAKIDAIDVRP
jgi:hypothetical protein